MGRFLLCLLAAWPAAAQTCPPTATYSPCETVFELNDTEAAAHPNPYASVQLHVEFRSPRHRTFLMPAYWDGGRRMVVRFAPVEAGQWDYRVTSNIERWNRSTGKFEATESQSDGFVKTANVHHFSYTENFRPHFWMGVAAYRFPFMEQADFQKLVDGYAALNVNHLAGIVLGGPEDSAKIVRSPEQIDPEHFQRLDQRIRYMNGKGVVADLILASGGNHLADLLPNWRERERFLRYLVARYAAFNITWQGVLNFEEYREGRELLKEVGSLLKKMDPYQHPRSTAAAVTSAPLLADGWMDYVLYQSQDDQLGAIEHQLYAVPFVNQGVSAPDADGFRRRLWNAAMNGQYVTAASPPAAEQMKVFHDFFAQTRHWDLEPYFDVDGGRALALDATFPADSSSAIEYIVYVEKPGPVEVLIERRNFNIRWFNPVTGEWIKQKDFKGDRFSAEPPDKSHDWVLHISREDKKQSMLRSYKFEARRVLMQEIELLPQKMPFEIEEPSKDPVSASAPQPYSAKIKRETRATRSMMWLWTGDVSAGGQGFRVLGTGQKGTFRIPAGLARSFPSVLALRLYGMNANGKVYAIDRTYKLAK